MIAAADSGALTGSQKSIRSSRNVIKSTVPRFSDRIVTGCQKGHPVNFFIGISKAGSDF
jgi:hypothetical protein